MRAIAQVYTVIVGVILLVVSVVLIMRIYQAVKGSRQPLFEVQGKYLVKALKLLLGANMVMLLVCIPIYGYIGSAFRGLLSPALNNALVLVSLAVVGVEFYLMNSISRGLLEGWTKKIVLILIVLVMTPINFLFTISLGDVFAYPEEKECILLDLPVKGEWTAMHAGGTELVNYHCEVPAQKYAMDIMKVDEHGQWYHGEGKENEDFTTLGQDIVSPAEGLVVSVKDGLPNQQPIVAETESEQPAGNHVVIEIAPERYLFLAHLFPGTVAVKEGQRVSPGTFIGKAGNSGNTTMPHLHMHIQNLPVIDNDSAVGFPYRFRNIWRKRWLLGSEVENAIILRNDHFAPLATEPQ